MPFKFSIHEFNSSTEAYDETQTDESIADGDVLVCGDGVVGILVEAWPVAVGPNTGCFHRLNSEGQYYGPFGDQHRPVTWTTFEGGKYDAAATCAVALSTELLSDMAEQAEQAAGWDPRP